MEARAAASSKRRSIFPLMVKPFPLVSPGLSPGISSLDKRVQSGGGKCSFGAKPEYFGGQDTTPVFVLQRPVLVESVVVGFQTLC